MVNFKATRDCPQCQTPLEKRDPAVVIKCPKCGWIWK